MAKSLLIIVTGGTLDSVCHDLKRYNKTSKVEEYILNSVRPDFEMETRVLCMKDSRDITGKDREQLASVISATPQSQVVITHGTGTMPETARFLHSAHGRFAQKAIVLTGAFIPLGDDYSDAPFNLGFAIKSAFSSLPGVWVAMNGQVYPADRVRKNVEKSRFEAV